MPKRATLTFSSDDASHIKSQELHVFYCKYSGQHAMTTDCVLTKAPRRRTDGAAVVDTERYQVKLYTTPGGEKLIKRRGGTVEKQYRLNLGRLPVAYRSEPEGRYLYVLDNAVTTYGVGRDATGGGRPPTPPCITAVDSNTTQIALEVDDHADKASVLKISADFVRVEVQGSVTTNDAREDLLELMRTILACRLGQLSLVRGDSTRHKKLLVSNMTPEQVFDKLRATLQK